MSAKGEKIVGNSPVFIGLSGGASTYRRLLLVGLRAVVSAVLLLLVFIRSLCVGYGTGVFELERGAGGRGVKEKQHGLDNVTRTLHVGTGLVNESRNGENDVVNEHGNVVLESSSNVLKNSVVNENGVDNVNVISCTEVDSVMAGHDNLHDENARQTPSNFTANPNKGNRIDVDVPLEYIRVISERFVNTTYGFFLGKRVAYHVVANYVRNTWGKYRLVKSMLNSSTGLFLFQFSSMDGLDSMLESGLCFIHNNLLILKKWDPDVNLLKEDVVNVPLDSYTSDMCIQSWGRSSYARAMIELRADVELKDTIVDECSKNLGSNVAKKSKIPSQTPRGVPVSHKMGFKPVKQVYRPVSKKDNVNISGNKKKDVESTKEVNNLNPFEFEKLIIDGKVTLMDDEGKPLKKIDYSGDHDSEDEVA
ncbi:zinc finger, CCHC-type containing protein [Tanacetum coccineum]|uniref:Zinc finger, CCHC-type containing protein n=1 Tax=Tanacetum coccineum TaxID=301880 RepID=A0ABQ4YHM8_9ASTR